MIQPLDVTVYNLYSVGVTCASNLADSIAPARWLPVSLIIIMNIEFIYIAQFKTIWF